MRRVEMVRVVLLTGPAGSGKTAVADAWARSRPYPTAHLSLDDVRDQLKAGYANPEDGWTEDAARQHALARRIVADTTRRYLETDVSVIIDDAIFPHWEDAGEAAWRQDLNGIEYQLIALLPRFEVVQERNLLRDGHRRLQEDTLRVIYDDMSGWGGSAVPTIDNSLLGIRDTVAAIDNVLDEG